MSNLSNETMNNLNGASKKMANDFSEKANEAMTGVEKMSRTLGQQAGQATKQVSDSMREYYDNGRAYVVENPVKGVAVAAAAGFVAGGMMAILLSSSRGRH